MAYARRFRVVGKTKEFAYYVDCNHMFALSNFITLKL